MNRRQFLSSAALLGLGSAAATLPLFGINGKHRRAPNVLFILTDDQGVGDVGWMGNPYLRTPSMDRLAREGTSFTQFNVSPTCSPTRAALLTGRHEFRCGITHTVLARNFLRREIPTMADSFRAAGYRTALFGKWHLGDSAPFLPEQRGFDHALYHGAGAIGQTPDYWGNRYFDPHLRSGHEWERHHGYCADIFFDRAWEWMTADNRPFFAWLAPNTPHTPLQVSERYSRRFIDMGLSETAAKFYGMIENLDENLGIMLAKLQRSSLAKDTLVVFMTDNGSAMGGEPQLGLYNAGLRGTKASAYEGGVRALCSFWLPGQIPPARRVDALAGSTDIFPTLAELCGLSTPEGIEGSSLLPLINGEEARRPGVHRITHRARWPAGADIDRFQYRGCSIRNQRHSMVDGRELYDLEKDPGQRHDVAAQYPEVARELRARYDAWWADVRPGLDATQAIHMPARGGPALRLDCHDWLPSFVFPDDRTPHLHQQWMVSQLAAGKGYMDRKNAHGCWLVKTNKPQRYRIHLSLLPREAGSAERARAEGVADLHINGKRLQTPVAAGESEAVFDVQLDRGEHRLEGVWHGQLPEAKPTGSFYAYVHPQS